MAGTSAYRPYLVAMIGAIPPFIGETVTTTVHHDLSLAIRRANRWRDAIAKLDPIPLWPFYFGVIDARDGSHPYLTDVTESEYGKARERPGFRPWWTREWAGPGTLGGATDWRTKYGWTSHRDG